MGEREKERQKLRNLWRSDSEWNEGRMDGSSESPQTLEMLLNVTLLNFKLSLDYIT